MKRMGTLIFFFGLALVLYGMVFSDGNLKWFAGGISFLGFLIAITAKK